MGKKVEPGKLEAEAAALGLVLVGPGKDRFHRTYRRIECGHEAQYQTGNVRVGKAGCQTCLDQRFIDEATSAGLVLLGQGKNSQYRTYRHIECGHVFEAKACHVREDSVRCNQCDNNRLAEEAAAAGLVLLGPGKDNHYRSYRWQSCGHEAEYQTTHVRIGNARCQACIDQKLIDEANAADLVLLGPGKSRIYRTYRWQSCGHKAEYQPANVRIGHVNCQKCEATAWSKPSNIYLLQFAADDGNTWLKLGVAKNIDARISKYGLLGEVRLIERLATIPTDTGKDAAAVEKALHTKFRKKRIHPGQMKDYMKNGHTECYPVTMRDEILEALSA
jgi:hypothetical protein